MFNNDAINRTVNAVVAVKNCVANYRKSPAFTRWCKNYVTREVMKAIESGTAKAAQIDSFLYSPEFTAQYKKAIQKQFARVEKRTRKKYADELQIWEIIQKMPRYPENKKIVIDI